MLLSGFLSDLSVDHVVVSPYAALGFLPANDPEEDDDEDEEQTAGHHQTNDDL